MPTLNIEVSQNDLDTYQSKLKSRMQSPLPAGLSKIPIPEPNAEDSLTNQLTEIARAICRN